MGSKVLLRRGMKSKPGLFELTMAAYCAGTQGMPLSLGAGDILLAHMFDGAVKTSSDGGQTWATDPAFLVTYPDIPPGGVVTDGDIWAVVGVDELGNRVATIRPV